MARPITFRSGILVPCLLVAVLVAALASCSNSGGGALAPPADGAVVIGPEGGVVADGDDLKFYIAPGALAGDARVTLAALLSPPPPPPGSRRVGRALEIALDGAVASSGMAVGLEFDYDPFVDPDGLAYRSVQLHRLDDGGAWQRVPRGVRVFPLALSVRVSGPGAYAAFIDTTTDAGIVADLYVQIRNDPGDPPYSVASATFSDARREHHYVEAVDGPRIGRLTLQPAGDGYLQTDGADISDPGQPCVFAFTSSEVVPRFEQSLPWFDTPLRVTSPASPGTPVPGDQPLTIAWDGASPDFVWMAVYGYADDGDFRYIGDMVPNDGAFVLEPEQLRGFASNTAVTVFLQRIAGDRLVADGLHPGSMATIQGSSRQRFVVR